MTLEEPVVQLEHNGVFILKEELHEEEKSLDNKINNIIETDPIFQNDSDVADFEDDLDNKEKPDKEEKKLREESEKPERSLRKRPALEKNIKLEKKEKEMKISQDNISEVEMKKSVNVENSPEKKRKRVNYPSKYMYDFKK